MARKKTSMDVWLRQRGKGYYLYHRLDLDGKMRGVSLHTEDTNEAKKRATDIVAGFYQKRTEASTRAALEIEQEYLEDGRVNPAFASIEDDLQNIELKQLVKLNETLFGDRLEEELDKTNPRLDTLWKLGTNYKTDSGILLNWLQTNRPDPTRKTYRAIWKAFRLAHPNLYRINEVTPKHIDALVEAKKKGTEEKKGLSPSSLNDTFIPALRSIFNILVEEKWYTSPNPVTLTKTTRKRTKLVDTIPRGQKEHQLKALFRSYGYELLFQLGLHTGMRRSEMTNLRWSEVYLNNDSQPFLLVQPHEADPAKGITKFSLKSKKSERKVPIKPVLVKILKKYHKADGYVIESDKYAIDRMYFTLPDNLIKKASLIFPKFHLHLLRHTFITRAISSGD